MDVTFEKNPTNTSATKEQLEGVLDRKVIWYDKGRTMGKAHRDLFYADTTQPRANAITDKDIKEKAESFNSVGQLNAVNVKSWDEEIGKFPIIAGETRWRGSFLADDMEYLEFKVIAEADNDEEKTLAIQLVENIQRTDVPALKQAAGINRLLFLKNQDRKEVCKTLGKSKSYISKALSAHNGDPVVHEFISEIKTNDMQVASALAIAYKEDKEKTIALMDEYKLKVKEEKTPPKLRQEAAKISSGQTNRIVKKKKRIRAQAPNEVRYEYDNGNLLLHIEGKEKDSRFIINDRLLNILIKGPQETEE